MLWKIIGYFIGICIQKSQSSRIETIIAVVPSMIKIRRENAAIQINREYNSLALRQTKKQNKIQTVRMKSDLNDIVTDKVSIICVVCSVYSNYGHRLSIVIITANKFTIVVQFA